MSYTTLVPSIRNSPWQSANAKAYLHCIVFASAIKMLRQLNSWKLKKNSFLKTRKEFFCKRKKISLIKKNFFTRHKLFMCIYIHYSYLHFVYFLTHYSSGLNRSSFPETLLCYALNEAIDIIHFFLSK